MKAVASFVIALSLSAPVLAQSDACFMKTSDGRVISLGKLCQGQQSAPRQSSAPVVGGVIRVNSARLVEQGRADTLRAVGNVTNISNQRQFVGFVWLKVFEKSTGKMVGSVAMSSGTGKWLKPGESTNVETIVLRNNIEGLQANEVILVPSALN